ncbi:hypothetical protein CBL_21506, partial [Carabus blaptoides fortunei]
FRDLNKIVMPQAQPFPLIEDLMIKTKNCNFFSTLDINSAFWSIPLRVEDRKKTAFVTQEGHFQWTCLPFGLKTSPAIFQRILSNILRKYKLTDFAVNYIDDILIFSKSFSEHINHLAQLLEAIKKEEPVLEIFDPDLPISIYTDASLEGVGAILKQKQPHGKEKPVAYFSKKLNEAQKKKKAIYLECLAITEAVRYWLI